MNKEDKQLLLVMLGLLLGAILCFAGVIAIWTMPSLW